MPYNEKYLNSPYRVMEIDLNKERLNEPLGLSGQSLIIFKNPTNISLKLDDIRNDIIPIGACNQSQPIYINGIPFKEIYLTNDATGGILVLILLYTGSTIELIDEIRKTKGIKNILKNIIGV